MKGLWRVGGGVVGARSYLEVSISTEALGVLLFDASGGVHDEVRKGDFRAGSGGNTGR